MKRAMLLFTLVATPLWARDPLGTFGRWSAFRDASPHHCFAIAEPDDARSAVPPRGFVSIATWPGLNVRGQFHVRLSRPRKPGGAVTLLVGERRFSLIAGTVDAWAPDARTDRAIVAAIRSGRSLSVQSNSPAGNFVDDYSLRGAATAIDTAALACATR